MLTHPYIRDYLRHLSLLFFYYRSSHGKFLQYKVAIWIFDPIQFCPFTPTPLLYLCFWDYDPKGILSHLQFHAVPQPFLVEMSSPTFKTWGKTPSRIFDDIIKYILTLGFIKT